MTSKTPTPTPDSSSTKDTPLSSFTRISNLVYLYRPAPNNTQTPSAPPATPKPPRLILLASWMDAQEPHIAKYTTAYQTLYPSSPILLIRSHAHNFTTKAHLHAQELQPAIPAIHSTAASRVDEADGNNNNSHSGSSSSSSSSRDPPAMLVHVFSNGGSATLAQLYRLYAATPPHAAVPGAGGGHPAALLPPHVTIFDSAPGRWQWGRTMTAFMQSVLPGTTSWAVRLAVRCALHVVCAWGWVVYVLLGRPGFLGRAWLAHNDRGVNRAECRRAYLYSVEDEVVDFRDVEEHAGVAGARGFVVVRAERFGGGRHVGHVRVDGGRYWGVVRGAWEGEAGRCGEVGKAG